jgi:cell division protease FtsH
MITLLEQKKRLIKNMTDIDLTISAEEYFKQFMEDGPEGEFIIRFEQDPDEKNESSDTKSENFEVYRDTGLNFKNVGGYELIKDELLQCADMLVNYDKYTKYNVRIPKGLILEGPPGNGKTLLAKCFSGEIKVSFIPVSGAQFQEKYVGVGAARVRELFDLATKNVPCIIFIDELDALCRKRSEEGTSRSEHDSTLNELLVNMDGFKSKPGIFIIGATNRVDLLDAAMTRPGRIDKKIYVGNPDLETRKSILKIHMKGKPMDKSITIDDMLQMSQGYSGAQIENFLNEAMLHALRDNRKEMTRHDLETMSTRTLTGFQAVETKVTPEQLYQVAIHEMGHAYTSILSGHKKVIKVNIHLWSPKSLGFTLFETQDNNMLTKESLMGELMVLLGGRVAEEIFFGDKLSTGSSHDIEQAKKIAEQMVVNWGMGDRIIYPSGSEFYKKILEQEIDTILQRAFLETKTLLLEHSLKLQEMAELLVKTREIKYADLVKS